jgi:hypothetical protein
MASGAKWAKEKMPSVAKALDHWIFMYGLKGRTLQDKFVFPSL